jgi:AcrR family transcriptional regulator
MTPETTPKRTLSTADERREAVLETAMEAFCARGYLGTPTTEIAKAAGISQAYLFRLFPTKTDLVLAVVARSNQRILEALAAAAAAARERGEDPDDAMGEAYAELLTDRTLLLNQIHQHAAAASMPEVAELARETFARMVEFVEREIGSDEQAIQSFFAHGMLMNTMAAIGAAGRPERWAQILTVC